MRADVVVVGGGPAGMSAAVAAAESGAHVIVLDEYAKPGGQFFKRTGDGFSVAPESLTREHARGEELRGKLNHPNITMLTRALVWGRFDDRVMVAHEGCSKSVYGKALVIATGLTHQSKLSGVENGIHKVGEVLLGCVMGLLVSWIMSRVWPMAEVDAKTPGPHPQQEH